MSEAEKHPDFGLFKTYLDTAEKVTQRRADANTWMLSVNSFVAGFYGYLKTGEVVAGAPERSLWLSALPIAGIFICLSWIGTLESYRRLTSAKFSVLQELETRMGVDVFRKEREHYKALGRRPLSVLEQKIPRAFIFLYCALLVASLIEVAASLGA